MARILVTCAPAQGHVSPFLPVVSELARRGHELVWYTGEGFRERVKAAGAAHRPIQRVPDWGSEDVTLQRLPGRRLKGVAQIDFYSRLFVAMTPGQVDDLREILDRFPADVILTDNAGLAPLFVSELGGPPCAVLGVLPLDLADAAAPPYGLGMAPGSGVLGRMRNRVLRTLIERAVLGMTLTAMNRTRERIRLAPLPSLQSLEDIQTAFLFMQAASESFEYPHADLPDTVHFIGPCVVAPRNGFRLPDWWEELRSARAVVHVTHGTIATDPHSLLVPACQALADDDVLVVVTTGGPACESLPLERLPANVHAERFLPHDHLLPRCDVMVTNGGYHGVSTALAHGVPMVVAPGGEEKIEVAARVAWCGAGIDLATGRPTPSRIRWAVRRVLAESRFRHCAKGIARDIARHDGGREGAELVERLVATKAPVRRQDAGCSSGGEPRGARR